MRSALVLLVVTACGGGASSPLPDAAPDGAVAVDAATVDAAIDAPLIDAAVDAPAIDAAPPGALRWGHAYGGSAFDTVTAMVTLPDDSVVIAGYTNGRLDLGGGLVGSSASEDRSVLLARYRADGTHLWSRAFRIASTLSDTAANVELAVGPGGDLYVATEATALSVDPGTGPLPRIGARDLLLVRFGANGTPLSARRLGGTGATVFARAVTVDASGEVYAAGVFDVTPTNTPTATIDLGDGALAGAGTTDAWVAKLDATLAITRWSHRLGAPSYPDGNAATAIAIEPASQEVVIAGAFSRTTDLGGGPRMAAGGGVGVPDLFLLSLHADGSYAGDTITGGAGTESCNTLRIDAAGRRWLSGTFNGTTTLGGVTRAVLGFSDGYALSLTGATAAYLLSIGAANHSTSANAITTGGVVAGTFTGTAVDVGGQPLTSAMFGSGFVARLGATGTALWANAIVSSGGGGVYALAETSDSAVVAGSFEGQVTLTGAPVGSHGFSDVFIAAYAR